MVFGAGGVPLAGKLLGAGDMIGHSLRPDQVTGDGDFFFGFRADCKDANSSNSCEGFTKR